MSRSSLLLAAAGAMVVVILAGGCSSGGGDVEGAIDLGDAQGALATPLERLDGEGTVRITDYAGTPVVVNFFAETCAPCVAEMPAFERVKQAAGGEVAFVGVSTQESVESGLDIVERTGVTWDLVRDPQADFFRATEAVYLPTTLVVDAEGAVVARRTGDLSETELIDLLADEVGVTVTLDAAP